MHFSFRWVLVLIAVSLLPGCSDETPAPAEPGPVQPDPIADFIESEPLPKPQAPQIIVDFQDTGLTFFWIHYDDLHRDMAGDWYDVAYGVKNGEKIGWIYLSGTLPDTVEVAKYDPVAGDIHLFADETWNALRSETLEGYDNWLYWGAFLPMLAIDADVPEARLLAIAHQLIDYISGYVAWQLLRNPTVQESREILTVLANLPGYDSYNLPRIRAQELLNALPDES